MGTKVFRYESASAKLVFLNNGEPALLRSVQSVTHRKGHGNGLMRKVTEYADKHNLTVQLSVQCYGQPLDTEVLNNQQLERWYASHGFQRVSKREPVRMIRYPNPDAA